MTSKTTTMSSGESWEGLISWDGDGELFDPLFQGDVGCSSIPTEYQDDLTSEPLTQESVAFDQQFGPSLVAFGLEGPPSDYATSGPPSVFEGSSSLGHKHSWLSGSHSYTTTATSPLAAREALPYSGSYDANEEASVPHRMTTASPMFDTQSFGSSSSYQTASASLFNPHLSGSPFAFSGLDVSASQALSHAGTWADPPIEPFLELEHEGAVPIPTQQGGHSFSNTFLPYPWTQNSPQQLHQTRPRAITIPHSQRLDSRTHQWHPRAPPMLSVSSESRRLPRNMPLSRSMSRSEPRRSRATPSPTSHNFAWVSYQPNTRTHRLMPSGTEGASGKRVRGRVGPLTAEQRSHAARVRLANACSNCRKRKEKCDTGIPCKSCLHHYKGDLINHPCRDRLLSDLSSVFLAERLGWHPTLRSIDSFIGTYSYHITTETTHSIPLNFGFGPALYLPVRAIQIEDKATLYHKHVIYSWPPSSSSGEMHTNAVLPAVLTPEAEFNLQQTLDDHLALLVRQHFRSFPLYCSQLRVLRDVYILYRSLPINSPYSRLLHQALKLLVLVHIGGDLTLPEPATDPNLVRLIHATMSLRDPGKPTPCFIRSQFGAVMPALALALMKEVLSSLERLFLNRESSEWPIALATLTVVLITIESIQYHAAKLPYHHSYDAGVSQSVQEHNSQMDDEGVKSLLAFYSACFSGCHTRLSPAWQGDTSQAKHGGVDMSPEDKFVESVRAATKTATSGGYLESRASAERVGSDMAFFFDRLAARLLVLKT